jgi:hypothetical protein
MQVQKQELDMMTIVWIMTDVDDSDDAVLSRICPSRVVE